MKMKIFEIENFRSFSDQKFSTGFSMKISMTIFDFFSISKILVDRFQNAPTMVLINRFGQNFMQNYVEFNGGGNWIKIQANSVRGRPLQKKWRLYKKNDTFRNVCHTRELSLQRAYHILLRWPNLNSIWRRYFPNPWDATPKLLYFYYIFNWF